LALLERSLSGRDRDILESVRSLRLVGARQIEALHFDEGGGSALTHARACRRVLERLTDLQLLLRLERRIGGVRAGSASYIYALGHLGQRLLAPREARRRRHEPSLNFVEHTLAIADAVVAITKAERAERLEVLELQTEPSCWRSFTTLGSAGILKPDLFLSVAVGQFELRWFIEIDLCTEHAPAIQRKATAYLRYLQSGREQADHEVFPQVLWTARDERRAVALRAALDAVWAPPALFTVTADHEMVDAIVEEGS
jgi:hypothetical protein